MNKDFKQLDLIPALQRAISDLGYETPTPIQAQSLPAALAGRDLLGCAQTGTGKTAAFALPILNALGGKQKKARPNCPIALILAPTRELAVQIGDSFRAYGKNLKLKVSLIYGGVSQLRQVRQLERGAQIVVATPGRLLDLMNQGHVRLSDLDIFVLDEADRMLDMGFLPDLKRIIEELPEQRQSLFFSATLPPNIRSLAKDLLRDPETVDVSPKVVSVEKIEQQVLLVQRSEKQSILARVLNGPDVDRAIVFTKTKRGANRLCEKLERRGMRCTAIHGDKSQNARQKALTALRSGRIKVLVATDVAARGIDIDGITHVVNYDIPNEPESYVHRIGRTGRAGATGIAVSLCTPAENRDLRAIEKLIGQKVPVGKQPPKSLEKHSPKPSENSTTAESEPAKKSKPTPHPRRKKFGKGSRPVKARRNNSNRRRKRKGPKQTQAV